MNQRLEQILQIHKMCLKELHQLESNVKSYIQSSTGLSELLETHWREVHQENNLALTVYDNFFTSITSIMDSARKFNIQIQLNSLKTSENFHMFPYLDEIPENLNGNQKYNLGEYCLDKVKSEDKSEYSLDSGKILYPAEEFAGHLDNEEEFIYPKLSLNDFYKSNTIIRASVTYINDIHNLKFSILDISSNFIRKIVKIALSIDFHQYHGIPPPNEVFGLALDQRILRAVRSSKGFYDQELGEEFWPCYLLDFGEIVRLNTANITYKLTEEQKTTPSLALLCQLECAGKNPFFNHKKMEDKLEDILYQNCELRVISVEENILKVQIIEATVANENINTSQDKKSHITLSQEKTNPFKKSVKANQHKLTEEELDMLFDEPLNTSNAMKAVMGYDPQDDKRICRFYNPSTGACFKGSRCKQEHIPHQSDGWTKDVVPATSIIDNRSPLVIYSKGAIINITPTYIGHFERFYAQINDSHQHPTPLIWNDGDVPQWKLLEKPPHIFELVLSRYDDGLWYRAKIVSHDDDYKMFKVFYVDYGNHQVVHLRNLARIDYSMAQLPFQAVLIRFAGAKEIPNIEADKRKKGVKMLCEMILNKSIDVKVVYHHEDLIVSLVNKKDFPIPEILIKMGYMRPFMS